MQRKKKSLFAQKNFAKYMKENKNLDVNEINELKLKKYRKNEILLKETYAKKEYDKIIQLIKKMTKKSEFLKKKKLYLKRHLKNSQAKRNEILEKKNKQEIKKLEEEIFHLKQTNKQKAENFFHLKTKIKIFQKKYKILLKLIGGNNRTKSSSEKFINRYKMELSVDPLIYKYLKKKNKINRNRINRDKMLNTIKLSNKGFTNMKKLRFRINTKRFKGVLRNSSNNILNSENINSEKMYSEKMDSEKINSEKMKKKKKNKSLKDSKILNIIRGSRKRVKLSKFSKYKFDDEKSKSSENLNNKVIQNKSSITEYSIYNFEKNSQDSKSNTSSDQDSNKTNSSNDEIKNNLKKIHSILDFENVEMKKNKNIFKTFNYENKKKKSFYNKSSVKIQNILIGQSKKNYNLENEINITNQNFNKYVYIKKVIIYYLDEKKSKFSGFRFSLKNGENMDHGETSNFEKEFIFKRKDKLKGFYWGLDADENVAYIKFLTNSGDIIVLGDEYDEKIQKNFFDQNNNNLPLCQIKTEYLYNLHVFNMISINFCE